MERIVHLLFFLHHHRPRVNSIRNFFFHRENQMPLNHLSGFFCFFFNLWYLSVVERTSIRIINVDSEKAEVPVWPCRRYTDGITRSNVIILSMQAGNGSRLNRKRGFIRSSRFLILEPSLWKEVKKKEKNLKKKKNCILPSCPETVACSVG